MQVERESPSGRVQWRTGEERVGNLPSGGGQHSERNANTAYDHTYHGASGKRRLKASPEDEPASHQLVGEVTAYQGEDG